MTGPLRDLPFGFRIAVLMWSIANMVVLGLFIVGSNGYRNWFFEWGHFLETLAFWTLFIVGENVWRDH